MNIQLPARISQVNPKKNLRHFSVKIITLYKKDPVKFWHRLLYWSFWLNIAFFPIGYGYREVMPIISFIFLLFYYRHAWRESILRNLQPAWLFLCPLLMTLIGIVFSLHPWNSLLHAGTGINKGFILPFIAMECVRSLRDLRNLVWATAFVCFWEGIDGIYQAITGRDFIMGYELHMERLTGSLGDYDVGNCMALLLIPAGSVWFILRTRCSRLLALFLGFALLWPGMFLEVGAAARSGMLALSGACFIWFLMWKGWKNIFTWLVPMLIPLIFYIFQSDRLRVSGVTGDNRWDLWRLAWKVFVDHPWLGAGAGQYNPAFREMGLAPVREVITISHPHNLYIDILYAHGITGFTLGMIFLFGFLYWGFKHIHIHFKEQKLSLYWILTAFFWLGYAGWLINGIFGHNFYRIWWLAEAMSWLGIMIGAIVNANLRSIKFPEAI